MQQIVDLFFYAITTNAWIWIGLISVLGLVIGSFLNVVIHRLPIMLEREWKAEAQSILSGEASAATAKSDAAPYNLVVPRSACPKCGAMITAAQNVPVFSYLFLKGKCAKCGAKISPRYPIVELGTAILSGAVAARFGIHWYTFAALGLTWALIALSVIDIDHQLLPDVITLPLVWAGLLISLLGTVPDIGLPPDMRSSILGAVFGYLSLWTVYKLYKALTGKEGMAYGDFKLLAALGAWLGWKAVPLVILFSAFTGAVLGLGLILFRGRDRNIPIPYGPYLAAAGWIALMWGDTLVTSYLRMSGMR